MKNWIVIGALGLGGVVASWTAHEYSLFHPSNLGHIRYQTVLSQLRFEPNVGQIYDGDVRFLARGPGFYLLLTPTELRFVERLEPSARIIRLVNANPTPVIAPLDELPGTINYFFGTDPEKWRTRIPTFAKIRYRDIYPGRPCLVRYSNTCCVGI